MTDIDNTARIDPSADIGAEVSIGPHCVIGPGAVIGDRCRLYANVIIAPGVRLGTDNRCFPGVVLGEEPQFFGHRDLPGELIIGDQNDFREQVTINRGAPQGGGTTIIGCRNYFMIGSHVGHDCIIQDNCCIGNYTQFSGHSKIESNVWLSAFCGTHQFVTVGRFAYCAGYSAIGSDVPPFVKVAGNYPCEVRGLNTVGLQRAGFPDDAITALKKAYKRLYLRREGSITAVVQDMMAEDGHHEFVRQMLEFMQRSFQHRLGRYREQFRH